MTILSREQRKLLGEQLRKAEYAAQRKASRKSKLKVPESVRNARRLSKAFEAQQNRATKKARQAVTKLFDKGRDALLFESAEKARATITALVRKAGR